LTITHANFYPKDIVAIMAYFFLAMLMLFLQHLCNRPTYWNMESKTETRAAPLTGAIK